MPLSVSHPSSQLLPSLAIFTDTMSVLCNSYTAKRSLLLLYCRIARRFPLQTHQSVLHGLEAGRTNESAEADPVRVSLSTRSALDLECVEVGRFFRIVWP